VDRRSGAGIVDATCSRSGSQNAARFRQEPRSVTIFVASVVIALTVSFFCSLAEATLLSLMPSQLAEVSARHPRQGAVWSRFKANIERPIAAILILNTTAHTIGASVAGAAFDDLYGDEWIWLFGVALTFVMLQYTEILPKSLGVRMNRRLAPLIARPLELSVRALTPVIHVIHWMNRPFERGRAHDRPAATVDELMALVAMARMSNQIGAHQERIMVGAARIARTPVRQIMIPVQQVSFLSTAMSLTEAFLAAHVDLHTRYPVCRGGDHDEVTGYVNFKELVSVLKTNPAEPNLDGITRPLQSIDPELSVADLLKALVEKHEHIAVVRDRNGRTLGIVTFEDAVEELVGEVEDEFDRLPRHVHELLGNTWLIGGGVPLRDLPNGLRDVVPPGPESFAAWIEHRLGRVPTAGDVVRCGDAEIRVRRVRRRRAFEASITRSVPRAAIVDDRIVPG
jgi:CBS domain containing-hemolysin-like protein